jgi:hypothetical protein
MMMMMVMKLFVGFVYSMQLSMLVYGAYEADRVTYLPGLDSKYDFIEHYSGYLDTADGRGHLHYWFVKSEHDSVNDPVVLWLNGGPGCSSLDGFFYEHGPFQFDENGKLIGREYRWNRIANMLYIEAPVGVGFSYHDDNDYANSDDRTAENNREALEAFYVKFPEYINNEFYITGESYAGIYVPTLAEAILDATDAGLYTGAALKGIAVGNGCTGLNRGICGWYFNGICEGVYYSFKYLLDLPFVTQDVKDAANKACDWDKCKGANATDKFWDILSDECFDLLDLASIQLGAVNIYNVFGMCTDDTCEEGSNGTYTGKAGKHTKGPDMRHSMANVDTMLKTYKQHGAMTSVGKVGRDWSERFDEGIKPLSLHSKRLSLMTSVQAANGTDDNNDDEFADAIRGPVACIESKGATDLLMQSATQEALHLCMPDFCWATCGQVTKLFG